MAKGKTVTITAVRVNNAKASTVVSKDVELIVKNDQLVPDEKETDPGINSRFQ